MAQPSLACGPGKQHYNCNSNSINYFSGCCSVNACVPKGCPDQAASSPSTSASGTPAAQTQGPLTIIEGLPPPLPGSTSSTLAKTSDTPAPPSKTPSTPSSSTSSSSGTLSTPTSSPPSNQAQATPTTVFLVTSEVFVTPAVVTPTINGVVLSPTSSEITSTALTSLSTVITPSSSFTSVSPPTPVSPNTASPTNVPASTSSSNTPIIAGVVGGVVGAAVAALLIWLLLRWHRRSKRDQIRAAQHDDDPRLQGIDANRAGDTFKADKDPSFAYTIIPQTSRPVTASSHDAPFSSECIEAGDTQNGGYLPSRSDYSPFAPSSQAANRHPATPMIRAATGVLPNDKDLEMAGSKLDPLKPHLELSGEPAANVAELAPLPERSLINAPKQPANHSGSRITGKAGPSPTTEGTWMHPNLDLSVDQRGNERAREGDERHVMSWASYEGNEPGPAR